MRCLRTRLALPATGVWNSVHFVCLRKPAVVVWQRLPDGNPLSGVRVCCRIVVRPSCCRYCNKGCLQDAIDRGWLLERPGGPVSLAKVIVTATEIAAGMSMLHKADVIHGDLSPYNVLLSGCVWGCAGLLLGRGVFNERKMPLGRGSRAPDTVLLGVWSVSQRVRVWSAATAASLWSNAWQNAPELHTFSSAVAASSQLPANSGYASSAYLPCLMPGARLFVGC